MTGCSAYGCKNRSEDGFKMKRFPKDPYRRRLWEIKVRRSDWTATDYCVLCESHFDETQFEKESRKFKKYAIPTIFAHTPPKPKRKVPTKIIGSQSKKSTEQIEELKKKLHEAYKDISRLKKENLDLKNKLSETTKSMESRAQTYIIISKGFS